MKRPLAALLCSPQQVPLFGRKGPHRTTRTTRRKVQHQLSPLYQPATIDRVEGRMAFLRAELKITEAQANAWNGFARHCAQTQKKARRAPR